MKRIVIPVIILLALLSASFANADGINLLPKSKVRNYHGIPFITGGVAEDLEHMKKVAKTYPLRMVFSEDGAYVTDVTVGIYDSAGILSFYNKLSGPYLYVNLPDGDYSIVAIYEGVKRSQKITIQSPESKKVFFTWPAKDADSVLEDSPSDNGDSATP